MKLGKTVKGIVTGSLLMAAQATARVPEIEYLDELLQDVMRRQEEALGIKHFFAPQVKFEFYDHAGPVWPKLAGYVPEEDTIYISPRLPFIYYTKPFIERMLAHELGHAYTDKLNESMGFGDWPVHIGVGPKSTNSQMCLVLVSEGIAEYFNKWMEDEQKPQGKDRPLMLRGFKINHDTYDTSYQLVRPIIDEHGPKGIEYLVKHPPQPMELANLKKYQDRVLKALGGSE